jgi:tetratricopeptide (TPR) repeat protein
MADLLDPAGFLDPELEAILQEVAKDPDSILLRVDRPKELKAITRGADTLVTGKVGFSAAEKQLLEVHREEAAYLLRLAYYELAEEVAEERERGLFVPPQGKAVETLGDTVIRERLRRQRELLSTDSEIRDGIDAGLLLLADPCARLVDLATASLRLVPSVVARNYIGREQLLASQLWSAEQTFARLNDRFSTPRVKTTVLCDLALTYLLQGRLRLASEAYQEASDLDPQDLVSATSWLAVSAQLGNRDDVVEASRRLGLSCVPGSKTFVRILSDLEHQRTRGIWSPSAESRQVVDSTSGVLSEAGRRVLSLFTDTE